MELKKYRLGELLTMAENGLVIKQEKGANGIPITRIETLSNDCFNRDRLGYANIYDSDKYKNYILDDLDLIMSHINSRTFLGRTVLYRKLGDEKVIHGMNVLRIKTDASRLNPIFAYYFFKTPLFKKCIDSIRKDAINQSSFALSDLKNIEIKIPFINEQQNIAKALQQLDRKIELNKRINDNLEAMAKQLYDYWFVQFDFPNGEGKPYKASGGKMVWNEKLKREIPDCFDAVKMGELCNFRNGINYAKDETGNEYKIVNVRNISSSRILLNGEEFDTITVPKAKAENYMLKSDDIIIARSGCPGATRILLSPTNTLFCGFIICCTPNDNRMRNYLTYCLKQVEGTSATISGGSILQNVSQDTLKALPIVIPTKTVLTRFNETIELIFARMLKCLMENRSLTKQRDELLPLLMNGQASVNAV